MNRNLLNHKTVSHFVCWEWAQIAVAFALLAVTVMTGLPMKLKLVSVLLSMLVLLVRRNNQAAYTQTEHFGVCLAVAIGVISICSKSSFLYPLNDWVDANCFFTVGKSMMNGVVPYRDLLEQKGPFLYFIHGLAWLISNDTFIGVYLFEVLAAAFFLYYPHRSNRLIVKSSWTVYLIPLYAAAIYTCDGFRHGDSVEELMLPFLAYAMWLGMDAICNKREITCREYFVIGLTSGLIFWSKFTLVGFYVGWYLFPMANYIRRGNWKLFLHSIGYILLGIAAATLPFVIYFGIHGAISDWLGVYLYDNLFVYSKAAEQQSTLKELLDKIQYGISETKRRNPIIPICGMISLLYFGGRKPMVGLYYLVTGAFALLFAFVGGVYYPYYSFLFNLYLPFGLIPLLVFVLALKDREPEMQPNRILLVALTGIMLIACMKGTSNRYLLGTPKEELPQYQFASLIGTDGSATLLNYGFLDGGFYTASNTVPNCKVFCHLNISPIVLLEIQNEYIAQGAVDYIVTRWIEIEDEKYEYLSFCDYYYEEEWYRYFLYKRV